MSSITSANATLVLSVAGLYPSPQQIQGFAAEDIFSMDAIDPAELYMGADGNLSAGFTYVAVKQSIHLQADSPSNKIFEALRQFELSNVEKSVISGVITIPSVKKQYSLVNGYLTSYPPIADAKRVLQPRKYEITWQTVTVNNTQ